MSVQLNPNDLDRPAPQTLLVKLLGLSEQLVTEHRQGITLLGTIINAYAQHFQGSPAAIVTNEDDFRKKRISGAIILELDAKPPWITVVVC